MVCNCVIICKLLMVEILGVMIVVCFDKIGILMMNEMIVKVVILVDNCYWVIGESYELVGNIYLEGSE